VPIEEVGSLLSGCRLVVLPYVRGNQSGVLHLAQSFSRPVVASAVGDIPDALGDGGLLVPPEDATALADALVMLLDDPELAGTMGRAARRRVEREASWDTVASLVEVALTDADPGRYAGRQAGDRPGGG
jgi:glycosyltransferase involved in cell wall biosynthesis